MKAIMLRDYQLDMLQRLQDVWTRLQSVMVQMPTGTGKTHLMAAVIRQHTGKGVLVVAHRRELIEQIGQTLDAFGIGNRRFGTGDSPAEGRSVVVASIQKLSGHIGEVELEPSLVIIDEAHHALAKTYRMLWDRWPRAKFLGLTATPCRLNGKGFGDLFQLLLQSYSITEFIERGWLSDFEYVSASPDSEQLRRIASLQKRGADGDYQTREMATVMDVPESVQHLYRTYRQFASGKKGIVYAIDQQHARHIAEYYCGQGVACAVIDAKTPAEERRRIIEEYKTHPQPLPTGRGVVSTSIDNSDGRSIYSPPFKGGAGGGSVLVNVDIFSEGFDCPEVEFIQLARPTLSLSKYLQQVGRGMRTSKGKDHVLILDNVGLYQTFGLPTDERDWKAYFYGRANGKGMAAHTAPVIIRDGDADQRQLVNLEMVRIKSCSEKLEGLAVYMQEGLFGVMKDGKQTTPPVFERIEKCQNGLFYAYGVYPYRIYRNRKTVIDLNGTDLGVQLYGNLELQGEFLHGQNAKGDGVLWDTKAWRYYQGGEPKIERAGWVDIIKVNSDEYEMRYSKGLHLFRFKKPEVWFNEHIAIIRDILIVRSDHFKVFKIFGYKGSQVLACGKKQCSTIPVSWNGQVGTYQEKFPRHFTTYPEIEKLHLKSVGGRLS